MVEEIRKHLCSDIIPFWKSLRDDEYGGYYGFMDYNLKLDPKAAKGCILNNRLLWFFSSAYLYFKDESLLDEAKHSYEFMCKFCFDEEFGGVYWAVGYDGKPEDTTKHTYNQAFSIYALVAYFEASKDGDVLAKAMEQFHLIEEKCTDEIGYLEAFDREFHLIDNDKLSENGVVAEKTMNTLLHVFEAYSELYRVTGNLEVKFALEKILDKFTDKIYNPLLSRQEVFFDREYNSILDLHSYGHDIETSWLLERGIEILQEPEYVDRILPITAELRKEVYKKAFDGRSLANERERGVMNEMRIWWVQAESVVGFYNGYEREPDKLEYLEAARENWRFIQEYIIDPREGSEWLWGVDQDGNPFTDKPIVEPWKCPYHNGRMCLELLKRMRG